MKFPAWADGDLAVESVDLAVTTNEIPGQRDVACVKRLFGLSHLQAHAALRRAEREAETSRDVSE